MSSQDASLVTTPAPSITQTSAPLIPPAILPTLETGSLSPTVTTDSALHSQITIPVPVATTQNSGNSAPTTTSGTPASASASASGSTSDIVLGTAATSTTTGLGRYESSDAGAGLTNGAENNHTGSAMNTKTTVAVAGGVIGGLALISILLFLIWFWRKRLKKNRRSAPLTPLSTGPADRNGERGPYDIPRNSLGPANIPEKVRAMVGYNYHRLRGRVNSLVTRSPKPGMDVNRGNSQFGPLGAPVIGFASRAEVAGTEAMTTKDRFIDWWGRRIEDGNLNWKLHDPKSRRSNNETYTSMPNVGQASERGSQPDFLEKQQQQGASNDTAAGSSNKRRSQSLGSAHFLGGLALNFDVENPFVDSNAMSHDSAMVMPLATSRAETSNPFSDANVLPMAAIPAHNNNTSAQAGGAAATYNIQNTRRSRGYSVSAASTRPSSSATAGRVPSPYRESSVSVETSDTRRNKFRSDPFDLDKPELYAPSPGSSARGVAAAGSSDGDGGQGGRYSNAQGLPNMPRPTHARAESLTSKYVGGMSSMADWGDPGPDVGPAAGRWNMPGPDGALGPPPLK